jgi:hypothetical protein
VIRGDAAGSGAVTALPDEPVLDSPVQAQRAMDAAVHHAQAATEAIGVIGSLLDAEAVVCPAELERLIDYLGVAAARLPFVFEQIAAQWQTRAGEPARTGLAGDIAATELAAYAAAELGAALDAASHALGLTRANHGARPTW